MSFLRNRVVVIILLVAIVLRIALAAITFHQDVRTNSFTQAIALKEGSLNFYDFYSQLDRDDPRKKEYGVEVFDDQPLQYLITLPVYALFRPMVNLDFEKKFHINAEGSVIDTRIYQYLLFLKLPFLIVDILLGLVLALFFKERKEKLIVFCLWLFNPITLWATAAVGQVDILPTFFMVLGLFLISKNRFYLASLMLGFGIALKSFPVFLLPFLVLLVDKFQDRLKIFVIALIPLVIFALPYLGSFQYRSKELISPQSQKILYANLPVSGGEGIFITLGIVIFIYFIFLGGVRDKNIIACFWLASLLLLLSFTHFHPQWFLWVVPFFIIYYKKFFSELFFPLLGLMFSWLGMVVLFQSSLNIGLFSPLAYDLQKAVGLGEILGEAKANYYKSILATIFAASAVYISLRLKKIPKIDLSRLIAEAWLV